MNVIPKHDFMTKLNRFVHLNKSICFVINVVLTCVMSGEQMAPHKRLRTQVTVATSLLSPKIVDACADLTKLLFLCSSGMR